MLFKNNSSTVLLSLLLIGLSPSLVLCLTSDSGLFKYLTAGIGSLEPRYRVQRDASFPLPSEKDVQTAVGQANQSLAHLLYFEELLHERLPPAEAGSPSHTAAICSLSEDPVALNIARESFVNARASYLLSHQICMRFGKPASFCGYQLTKQFQTKPKLRPCEPQRYRTYNGSCNNKLHPSWGAAFTTYSRLLPPTYKDGIWEPRSREVFGKLGSAVEISEGVQKKGGKLLKDITLTTASWAGVVAYDLAHTVANRMFKTGDAIECCEEERWKLSPRYRHPLCMPVYNRAETKCFNYVRSMLAPTEGYRFGPAEQMNAASQLLDGSGIYGSSEATGRSLRTGKGGQLKVLATSGLTTAPSSLQGQNYLFTGEIRLNADMISAVLHVVLINEHNRLAGELSRLNPDWTDEILFQEARRILVAQLQHITYSEWLPVILGEREVMKHGLQVPKSGYSNLYNPEIRPAVFNSFANAAMRFIFSLLDEQLHLYNEDRSPAGNMSLQLGLIQPEMLANGERLAALARSLATQNCQATDLYFPQAVTKYLYSKANGTAGFDALSLDIQRGRDHGLPPYVAFRKLYGYPHETFEDLTTNIRPEVVAKLKTAYEKPAEVDLVVGGLAESPKGGSLLGPVFTNIIARQMLNTRLGDAYFYDNSKQPHPFTPEQLDEIRKATLARLLCDNTEVKRMQPNAFRKPGIGGNKLADCSDVGAIPRLNLNLWKEGA